jgi:predicted NUDIX family phosphoesterase
MRQRISALREDTDAMKEDGDRLQVDIEQVRRVTLSIESWECRLFPTEEVLDELVLAEYIGCISREAESLSNVHIGMLETINATHAECEYMQDVIEYLELALSESKRKKLLKTNHPAGEVIVTTRLI